HNSGISYGNAIGSVICNTSLIAALTIAIRPSGVKKDALRVPVIAFFSAALIYSLIAYTAGEFQRWQGVLFLALFTAYMILTVYQMKKNPDQAEAEAGEEEERPKDRPLWQELLALVAGAAAIAVGARLLVDNGTLIAAALGVPDSVIGLTMVALGTSLPELVTAVTALAKGHSALSLGNIIGANLFNIVLVSGTAITISPFTIPAEKTLAGMNASLLVDIPVMLGVMALLCLPALTKGKLSRWQGITLLCVYVAFTVFQFIV
ncbi:MAG: sodium:calcium antiporter, partial [Deltaproteobacteria bacterium]|nr:sodium:calcium antiporter [Deltaproteobacteria bacterium]